MASSMREEARNLYVAGSYDVVVVGGGVAGVAAAMAAGRNGASVCLLEKQFALGGLATLGNVVLYMHLCDGRGRKVVGGIGMELMKLSIADGFSDIPAGWKRGAPKADRLTTRLHTVFNPASYMLALEKAVLDAGVKLYYDMRFCDVITDSRSRGVRAVVVESKSGRQAIRCSTVIDASGDADVCHAAGEQTVSLDTNGWAGWFFSTDGREVTLQKNHGRFDRYCKAVPGERGYRGDDADSVTQHVIDSRVMIRKRIAKVRRESGVKIFSTVLPLTPDLRMTRRLKSRCEIRRDDDRRAADDCIGLIGDWREAGPLWSIPFGALLAARTPNLMSVGRCMSVDNDLWDATRVIPACAVTGEAAGTAAAMAAAELGGRVDRLDVSALQAQLVRQKVLLDDHRSFRQAAAERANPT